MRARIMKCKKKQSPQNEEEEAKATIAQNV